VPRRRRENEEIEEMPVLEMGYAAMPRWIHYELADTVTHGTPNGDQPLAFLFPLPR
jgi:hypothetical protein